MLSEIWKFLNAPIVIVAIVVLALLFVLGPRVYTRSEPHSSSTSQYVRTALVDLIPELADMSVGNVNLSREASDYFTYIVEFNTQDDISSVGLRLVALMDGTWLYR